MEVDEERDEINRTFDQLTQSQNSQQVGASQVIAAAPPIPQSNVGNRRKRRDDAGKGGQKLAFEPGFGGNDPAAIKRIKKAVLEKLKNCIVHKKTALPSKKDCFNETPLDMIDQVCDYLDLTENGELVKLSSLLYALRVDNTYNETISTNCLLQPTRMKSQDMGGKKTKTEQKVQQATATQSLNLQKLQHEMQQDMPEDAGGAVPAFETLLLENSDVAAGSDNEEGRGEGDVNSEMESDEEKDGMGSDEEDEERRKEEEMTEEQKERARDAMPYDAMLLTYIDNPEMCIKSLVEAEYTRRSRNLDRKCDLNPMLMDDEKKSRMEVPALLTNEYYQIATARYKDLNASGLLTYNAKVTHNGRMTLMHKHMDSWKDLDVNDFTEPTIGYRKALAGLVDNALRDKPQPLPNFLFDKKDKPPDTLELKTDAELAQIERETREKVLNQDDDFFLDNDQYVEEYDEPPEVTKSMPIPIDEEVDDDDENGDEGETNESQAGPSSVLSGNPSTPAAETETSETSRRTTPKIGREGERVLMAMSQAEKEDFIDVISNGPKKRRFKKASSLAAVMSEDEIPGGPVLSTDDLASQFQQILFEKASMGSHVKWRHGANAEELQAEMKQVQEESCAIVKRGTDIDLMHLDQMWMAKYYTKTFTLAEMNKIQQRMQSVEQLFKKEYEKKITNFSAGEYEFIGQDDEWRNDDIPVDEWAHLEDEEKTLVRQLEDKRELERHIKKVVEKDSDEEDEEAAPQDDDDRIVVEPQEPEADNFLDDGVGSGFDAFSDNEEPPTSSTGDKPSDFTAGDDQREGEILGDVMQDPTFVSEVQPSEEVRATGKKDDSHWKGKAENAKVKKEKKKKAKDEPMMRTRSYFDLTDEVLDKSSKFKFDQVETNDLLMQQSDKLLIPIQVAVMPQMDYNTSLFYRPFLLPEAIHSKYVERPQESADEGHEHYHDHGHLGHYAHMLDTSMNEAREGKDDVFISFLRTFRSYPEVATHKEIEMEERVRSGDMQADEAAAMLRDQDDEGAMGADNYEDNDFGGGEEGVDNEEDGTLSRPRTPSQATFRHRSREPSQARSIPNSTHGAVFKSANEGDDESESTAKMGDQEVNLRVIKLDTVAMKTALSDVLTSELMGPETLERTLGHFYRELPDERKKKKEKKKMQTINEDEEMALDVDEENGNNTSANTTFDEQANFDRTMQDARVPDALNVTRALFAPKKEIVKPNKTMVFGEAASTSQTQANRSTEHIEIKGKHTLQSTFTCLPARMPDKAVADVTVASTIAMILHLANENNLILVQPNQDREGIDEDGNTTMTDGTFMNDFIVEYNGEDLDGSRLADVSQRITDGFEVLQTLSADEDPSDAHKRQKMLEEIAFKQSQERVKNESAMNGIKKKDGPSTSRVMNHDEDSDDDIIDEEPGPSFRKPSAPPALKRTPRKSGNDEDHSGPSIKRPRTQRTSNGTTTTVDLEDTILIDD